METHRDLDTGRGDISRLNSLTLTSTAPFASRDFWTLITAIVVFLAPSTPASAIPRARYVDGEGEPIAVVLSAGRLHRGT